MKNKLLFIGKLVFTILLFYIIFQYIDIDQLKTTILTANPLYFVIMSGIWYVGLYVSALRWNTILHFYQISISTYSLYTLYWIGSFFNNFLPSSFGGDSYKFIHLNKQFPNQKSKILSSIILERLIGLLTGIPIAVVTGILLINNIDFSPQLYIILSLLLGLFIGFLFLIFTSFSLPQVNISLINKVSKGINTLLDFNDTYKLLWVTLYSLVFLILNICSLYFGFQAFTIDISLLSIAFVYPILQITGAFPFSLNALGIKEGASIYLFSLFGVSPEATLSVMVANRLLMLLVSSTGGIRYLLKNLTQS